MFLDLFTTPVHLGKVKSCPEDRSYWYRSQIGSKYAVVDYTDDRYEVVEIHIAPENYRESAKFSMHKKGLLIHKEDFEIIQKF